MTRDVGHVGDDGEEKVFVATERVRRILLPQPGICAACLNFFSSKKEEKKIFREKKMKLVETSLAKSSIVAMKAILK